MSAMPRETLARVLGLLGSSFDTEALAAARMAERLRLASGLTWQDLLSDTSSPTERPIPPPRHQPRWRDLMAKCQRRAERLSPWERDFLAGIACQSGLSTRQRACLERIATKI